MAPTCRLIDLPHRAFSFPARALAASLTAPSHCPPPLFFSASAASVRFHDVMRDHLLFDSLQPLSHTALRSWRPSIWLGGSSSARCHVLAASLPSLYAFFGCGASCFCCFLPTMVCVAHSFHALHWWICPPMAVLPRCLRLPGLCVLPLSFLSFATPPCLRAVSFAGGTCPSFRVSWPVVREWMRLLSWFFILWSPLPFCPGPPWSSRLRHMAGPREGRTRLCLTSFDRVRGALSLCA